MSDVTLVLPCLNEEKGVGVCVRTALDVFRDADINGEVIVVDNGSKDRSIEVAKEAGARVLSQTQPGYGAALRTGISAATSPIVIMADADGTYELQAIPRLIQPILDGTADLVLGARLEDASSATMPFLHRYLGTPTLSWLVRRAAGGINVSDSQSGFRAFRREAINDLNLTAVGMEFASEMLVCAGWAKLRISEVPTKYAERIGESKLETFSDGLRHLRQLLLLAPDVFAILPGSGLIALSIALWIFSGGAIHDLSRPGSLGWFLIFLAQTGLIIGSLTWIAGVLLRHRAIEMGFRHSERRMSLRSLIRLLTGTGVASLLGVIGLAVLGIVSSHRATPLFGPDAQHIVSSIIFSGTIIGIILCVLPIISPLMTRGPMEDLPDGLPR